MSRKNINCSFTKRCYAAIMASMGSSIKIKTGIKRSVCPECNRQALLVDGRSACCDVSVALPSVAKLPPREVVANVPTACANTTCMQLFLPHSKNQAYCSPKCRMAEWHRSTVSPNLQQRSCVRPGCGRIFQQLRTKQRYCCTKCRVDHWMQNNPRVKLQTSEPGVQSHT